jgi:hypothetical protein
MRFSDARSLALRHLGGDTIIKRSRHICQMVMLCLDWQRMDDGVNDC